MPYGNCIKCEWFIYSIKKNGELKNYCVNTAFRPELIEDPDNPPCQGWRYKPKKVVVP